MTIINELAVKIGSYETKNGETKNKWLTIGQVHEGKNGAYITLYSHVNLAAIPRKEGDERVMVSMFAPKEKAAPRQQEEEDFNDSIPF